MWRHPKTNTSATAAPLHPSIPVAKRLNRNALLVLAVILGLTAIVVVVTMQPRATIEASPQDTPPRPGVPEFLRNPVSTASPSHQEATPEPWVHEEIEVQAVAPADPRDSKGPTSSVPPAWDATGGTALPSPGHAVPTVAPMTSREVAYQRALQSDPFAADHAPRASAGSLPRTETAEKSTSDESLWRDVLAGVSMPSDAAPSNGSALPTAFNGSSAMSFNAPTSATSVSAPQTTVATSHETVLVTPSSPYVINAGTILSGLLITSVVSDLPGEMIGQLSHDVYDSPTQQALVLPKGSKFIGTYDNGIALGQQRLLVTWTRIILPDGRSLPLPNLRMSDAHGAAGVRDQVDNHYGRIFGNALALSVISAGVQLSQPRQPTTITAAPSVGQTAAGALGQELGTLSTEMTRRNLSIQSTLTIRAGTPFTVIVRGDLEFPGPYPTTRASIR